MAIFSPVLRSYSSKRSVTCGLSFVCQSLEDFGLALEELVGSGGVADLVRRLSQPSL